VIASVKAQDAFQRGEKRRRQQHDKAGEPQALRDPERDPKRRVRDGVELERLPEFGAAVENEQRGNHGKRERRNQIERRPRLYRKKPIDDVDANMTAIEERQRAPDARGDRQGVAGKLVGAAK
jgi:hypothetical protein